MSPRKVLTTAAHWVGIPESKFEANGYFRMSSFMRLRSNRMNAFERIPSISKVQLQGLAAFCYPDASRKLFDKKHDTNRLFRMTFKSNAHKTSPMDLERVANWLAAHRNLDRIMPISKFADKLSNAAAETYNETEPGYRVTVWFCISTTNTDRVWKE